MLRLLVTWLLLPIGGAAQFPTDEQLGALLESRVDEGAVGIALGLLEADGSTRVLFAGSAGKGARPLGPQTVFEIGSITKVFTGTLLADMARRGEVSLTDPVALYLPEGVLVPSRSGTQITLLDLATHRSGLPRMPSNQEPADASRPFADYSVERMYAFLSDYELERDIGSAFEYSNLGVGLLGQALSRAAGVPYELLIRKRVLDPLEMVQTGVDIDGEILEWMARGHGSRRYPVAPLGIGALAASGALRSDVLDMLRFLEANIGEPTSELEESMRAAHAPRPMPSGGAPALQSIGLNWLLLSAGDTTLVWHNGATQGFLSFIGFDPHREIGVVVLGNSRHPVQDIGFHLLNPAIPLSEPSGRGAGWLVAAPLTAASVGVLLLALWGRLRRRQMA